MNRRKFIGMAGGTVAAITAVRTFAAEQTGKRPNVLWLIAEDFGQHLGCYGAKDVSTPNLDALAAQGMLFKRFFTTAPVCSPSRSSFMTGMYPIAIKCDNHRSKAGPLSKGVRLLTHWLKDAGYFTANIVKMPGNLGIKGGGKIDWNFEKPENPYDSSDWSDLKSHQPFYAQMNFGETHRVYNAPKHADPAKVEIPPYYPDHPVTREDWAKYLDSATELDRKIGLVLKQLEDDGLADNTVVAFFGDNGQSHVRGKQFVYDEGLLVPFIMRWPKKFPIPANFKPGTVSSQLLETIDLTATTLAIAGAVKPAKMQGQVFLGPNTESPKQYVFGARSRCDETVMRLRSARDARYRYIRNFMPEVPFFAPNKYKAREYPVWNLMKQLHVEGKLTPVQELLFQPHQPPEELYDLEADPYEINNIVSSSQPEHQAALERLRKALAEWRKVVGDTDYPEPEPKATKADDQSKKK